MTVYKVGGIWRYRFMLNGRRYFKALPEIENKSQARAAEEARKTRIREGQDDEAGASANFRDFVRDTFLPWAETNLAPGTYRSYKWRSEDLCQAFGELEISEISRLGVEKLKREQLKRKTKRGDLQTPASVNRYLQSLGSIPSLAEDLGLIKHDERPKLDKLREANHRIRYLTTAEESQRSGN